MTTPYDEFSIYITEEEVIEFVNSLIDEGFDCSIKIYERCIEEFGYYFQQEYLY